MKNIFKNKWFLICISAVLYALPFLFTKYLYGIMLIALIPLFIAIQKYTLSFKEGFVWGYIYFFLMFSGFIESNFIAGKPTLFTKILPSAIICIYISLFSAFTFYLFNLTNKKFGIKNKFLKLFLFAIFFFIYVYVIDNYLLWPLSLVKEGFFIFHPTLPLAYNDSLLYLIGLFGKIQITFIIIFIQCLIAFLIATNKKTGLILSIILILPLLINNKMHPELSFQTQFAYLPINNGTNFLCDELQNSCFDNKVHESYRCVADENYNKKLMLLFEVIKNKIIDVIKNNPQINSILIPETSFFCDFSKQEKLLTLLDEKNLGKKINIFCGAIKIDGNYQNTIYWIYNGKIIDHYSKTHALFPGEFTKAGLPWSEFVSSLYSGGWPKVTISKNIRPLWEIDENFKFTPYICSEVFFNEHPQETYNQPIIAFCKDHWLKTKYLDFLLFLHIKLKSVLWNRMIIYINFNNGYIFNNKGQFFKLKNYK